MVDNIKPVAIEDKMKKSYLNYSLSVIVGRALPDVRDGLKPVHRRILYAARELGLTADKPHKKSARIVGEVLGKYHPHGDRAVYDAMVRMAQPFNQRYLLIDGHGNFGSIDGDSPAAMRYTEARLTRLSEFMLTDIKQETVNFIDNFDGTLEEPVVLPSRIPNLLVNGSSGIAVGMSTDIPPHNLSEVIRGIKYLIKHPGAAIETLMNYIPGPDFPTGAKIIGNKGIEKAYKTGKGKIKLRARTTTEKVGRKQQIIVTELPYQVNKAKLIENIAELIKKEKLTTISDLRDESDQEGMRIVLELKQGTDSELVLNRLFKYTSLQTNYRINMLALIDNRPKVMNLKTVLQHFIDFRRKVVSRRTSFLLNKAKNRQHILQGLIEAISELDLVISIIRNSKTASRAKKKLQQKLEITIRQAEAILNMKLQRLVGMETDKLKKESAELTQKINYYNKILEDREELDELIIKELEEVRKNFADERKTELIDDGTLAKIEKQDLIKEKKAVISYSFRGKIKRSDNRENIRAAKNDHIINISSGNSFNTLLFFTDKGQVYSLPIHQIPEHHGLSTGDNLNKYVKIPLEEKIIYMTCLNENIKNKFITMATAGGYIKKTVAEDYQTSYTSIKAIKLNDEDQVIDVTITDGNREIFLGTEKGRTIRFKENSISDTGRNTIGNLGIKLAENDRVIDMNIVDDSEFVVTISSNGKANKIDIREFKLQKRNGKGLKTTTADNYNISAIKTVKSADRILITGENEQQYLITMPQILTTQRPGYMYNLKNYDEFEVKEVYKLPKDLSTES